MSMIDWKINETVMQGKGKGFSVVVPVIAITGAIVRSNKTGKHYLKFSGKDNYKPLQKIPETDVSTFKKYYIQYIGILEKFYNKTLKRG